LHAADGTLELGNDDVRSFSLWNAHTWQALSAVLQSLHLSPSTKPSAWLSLPAVQPHYRRSVKHRINTADWFLVEQTVQMQSDDKYDHLTYEHEAFQLRALLVTVNQTANVQSPGVRKKFWSDALLDTITNSHRWWMMTVDSVTKLEKCWHEVHTLTSCRTSDNIKVLSYNQREFSKNRRHLYGNAVGTFWI